jgi:hypothetical protein
MMMMMMMINFVFHTVRYANASVSFVMYVCLSVHPSFSIEQLVSHWKDYLCTLKYRKPINTNPFFPPPVPLWPNAGHDLLILEVSRSHTTTHHSQQDSSGRVIRSSQRPLPNNTQHSQQTFMPPGGFRTHSLSRRAAANLRLRPRGQWDRKMNIRY